MNKLIYLLTLLGLLIFQSNSFAQDKTGEIPKPEDTKSVQDQDKAENTEDNASRQVNSTSPFEQKSFIPDISLILDTSYVYRNISNDIYNSFKIPNLSGVDNYQKNGFNLNYAELNLASTVDPYFDLSGVFTFTPQEVGIEEVFINTRSLPFNFQLKAGKFRSNFGRLNSQHEHVWDFSDPPLVYTVFFGEEQLNEKGIQLNWLAPLDIYLQLGTEVLQGENTKSFGTEGFEIVKTKVSGTDLPNLLVAYAKSSVDFENLTVLGGLTFAGGNSKTYDPGETDKKNQSGFSGAGFIYAGDLTLKYFFDSYNYLSLQSEYLHRYSKGRNYTLTDSVETTREQSGLYSQITWRFDRLWGVGARLDLLNKNEVFETRVNTNSPGNLARYSLMFEYHPTEFSRFRLQFNHDRTKYNENDVPSGNLFPVNELFLQLNMAIGAHGAHQF